MCLKFFELIQEVFSGQTRGQVQLPVWGRKTDKHVGGVSFRSQTGSGEWLSQTTSSMRQAQKPRRPRERCCDTRGQVRVASSHVGVTSGTFQIFCRARPCLLVAVVWLGWCSWWLRAGLWGCGCFCSSFQRRRPEDLSVSAGFPFVVLDFGSLHQKQQVGGPSGSVRRDGSDLTIAGSDNTGERGGVPPPLTIAFWARRQVPKFVTNRAVDSERD